MSDDRIRRLLEAAEQPLTPSPEYAAALLEDLKAELGFDAASTVAAGPATTRSRHHVRTTAKLPGLLAATILVAGLLTVLPIIGAISRRLPAPAPDALAAILARDRITIAITPDHPQLVVTGVPITGFDADVAGAIADELGVGSTIEILDAAEMFGREPGSWDVAMPSVPRWSVDGARFEVSAPYYYWPHRVVVTEASDITTIAELAGADICAVAGDAAEGWLRGDYGDEIATPRPATVTTRATDDECLAAVIAGEVAAAVTAKLSDADVEVRPGLRVIDGPPPEPRSALIPRGSTPADERSALLEAIDRAIASIKADGTLTRLSQNRFGGADLSTPP